MKPNHQIFTNIPIDELTEIISEAVTIALKKSAYPSNAPGDEKPLSRNEAAKFLCVNPTTISRYVHEGKIRGTIIKRKIYIKKSVLTALLENDN